MATGRNGGGGVGETVNKGFALEPESLETLQRRQAPPPKQVMGSLQTTEWVQCRDNKEDPKCPDAS